MGRCLVIQAQQALRGPVLLQGRPALADTASRMLAVHLVSFLLQGLVLVDTGASQALCGPRNLVPAAHLPECLGQHNGA
jgi:hypothetical protein